MQVSKCTVRYCLCLCPNLILGLFKPSQQSHSGKSRTGKKGNQKTIELEHTVASTNNDRPSTNNMMLVRENSLRSSQNTHQLQRNGSHTQNLDSQDVIPFNSDVRAAQAGSPDRAQSANSLGNQVNTYEL